MSLFYHVTVIHRPPCVFLSYVEVAKGFLLTKEKICTSVVFHCFPGVLVLLSWPGCLLFLRRYQIVVLSTHALTFLWTSTLEFSEKLPNAHSTLDLQMFYLSWTDQGSRSHLTVKLVDCTAFDLLKMGLIDADVYSLHVRCQTL